MRLRAGDVDALLGAARDMHEEIGVRLLRGRLAAVALHIGHRAADHEIPSLNAGEKILEPAVIGGAVLAIEFEGHRVKCVERIHADAALEAGAGELTEPPLHLVLHDEIGRAFRNMQKTIHALAREWRDGGGQFRVPDGEIIGFGNRVDRGPDDRMVDRLRNPFAHQIDLELTPAQALDIFGARTDRISRERAAGHAACTDFLIHIELLPMSFASSLSKLALLGQRTDYRP